MVVGGTGRPLLKGAGDAGYRVKRVVAGLEKRKISKNSPVLSLNDHEHTDALKPHCGVDPIITMNEHFHVDRLQPTVELDFVINESPA